MTFFLDIVPPKSTAQEKKIAKTPTGKVVVYESENARAARELLTLVLRRHTPAEPMTGPIRLATNWWFPRGRHPIGPMTTRPDTDNLNKALKDAMTRLGFWHDDSQVAVEIISKYWADKPGITVTIEPLEGDDNE